MRTNSDVCEEGIWETPEESFAVFENAAALFNHTWTLVGRDDALIELGGLLDDETARVVFLTGSGGSGKSRVVKCAVEKFKVGHKGTTIRLLSRTSNVTKKSLGELRSGPALLIVDDAHDRTDLPLLFEFVAARANVKLLLALRPYGLNNLKAQAGMFALVDSAKELALGALTKQQAEELAKWTAAGLVDKSQPHAAALSNASGLTPPRWL